MTSEIDKKIMKYLSIFFFWIFLAPMQSLAFLHGYVIRWKGVWKKDSLPVFEFLVP